ncbi:response regulator [Ponticoccus alexandrii]|uniref:Response regulator n=1 Tax=Ponticoccus alexandrii TaxID=1943633 RepID=A0ABX7F6B1_9RHOB|nr:response regulator [Ponticoccus alexandrii]QRF66065.1 response regulator [Ponticoccus alexandrii]
MKILAVDDSPISRDLLPVLFSSSDFPPLHVAESGAAALAILGNSDQLFDCLILDIEMPGMDGIELCSRVRQLARYRDVPIIMLTARDDAQTIETAFAAGANDYILKSAAAKELVGRVHVAQRMLRRNACKILSSKDLAKGEATPLSRTGKHSFALADSLLVEGVDRLILPFSLGNYLTQLPAEALAGTRIFGVQIEDPVRHYHDNTTRNFATILARVAKGICATVETDRLLMSYVGGGAFYCIARDIVGEQPQEYEAGINRYLDTCASASVLAALQSVSVCVSALVAPSARRGQRVRVSFDRVKDRVNARVRMDGVQHKPEMEGERTIWQ